MPAREKRHPLGEDLASRRDFAGGSRWALLTVSVVALFLLHCGTNNNPFDVLSNAEVHVVGRSFGTTDENDSLTIFTTYNLSMVPAVREEIDSFLVIVPASRFADTARFFPESNGMLSPGPFHHSFSITDTGHLSLAIHTFRKNAETAITLLPLRIVSPLKQDTVFAFVGDTITLSTDSVGDSDVWYWWSLDDLNVIRSSRARVRFPLNTVAQVTGTGMLWVSDPNGITTSPSASFTFYVNDSLSPSIELYELAEVAFSGDTLIVPDSSFTFQVRISDRGEGIVRNATVNGHPFDKIYGSIYSKRIEWDNAPAAPEGPYAYLEVIAEDLSHNADTAVFWVRYDASAPSPNQARLHLRWPPTTPFVAGSPVIPIVGEVQGSGPDSLSLVISIDSDSASSSIIHAKGPASGTFWAAQLSLNSTRTNIAISIFDSSRGMQIDTSLEILYAASSTDTLPPVVADVWIGEDKDFSRAFVTHDTLSMKIIAFDERGPVQALHVNGHDAVGDQVSSYLWNVRVPLSHASSGNALRVVAIDSSNNRDTLTGLVYHNHPAVIEKGLIPPSPFRARSLYTDTLVIGDPDGDNVLVTEQRLPQGATLDGRVFVWIPEDSNVGNHEVRLSFFDGFQATHYLCTLQVLPFENAPCSLSAVTAQGVRAGDTLRITNRLFPETLMVRIHDDDPLESDLHTVSVFKGSHLSFHTIDTTRTLQVVIDPGKATYPTDSLRIVVQDRAGAMDSLFMVLHFPFLQSTPFETHFRVDTEPLAINDTIVGFPLLVRLDSSNFRFDIPSARGSGLRFFTHDSTQLPFEIEHWDSIGESASIWVLMDTIYPEGTSWILMTNAPNIARRTTPVFSGQRGFAGVWHCSGNVNDATENGYDAVNKGLTPHLGAIGLGMELDGTSSRAVIGQNTTILSGTRHATISGWINQHAYNDEAFQSIVSISIPSTSPSVKSLATLAIANGGDAGVFARDDTDEARGLFATSPLSLNTWHHLVGVINYEKDSLRIWIDGVLAGEKRVSFEEGETPSDPSHKACIGSQDDEGSEFFDGVLDELRVERVVRQADWIRLCYENQRAGSLLVRFQQGSDE